MQFKHNSEVLTSDEERIGRIERVVIDPLTKEVTDLIVRKGFLLADDAEDKVVPIDAIAETRENCVLLREGIHPEMLRPFADKEYVPISEDELQRIDPRWGYIPSFYWVPPLYVNKYPDGYEPHTIETEQNIPEGTIAVKEGAQVISADEKHVGKVERVITRQNDQHATHLLISRGWLLRQRKIVPMNWVSLLGENDIHLHVGSSMIDSLPRYEN